MKNYYLNFSFFTILLISVMSSCTKDQLATSYPDELTIDNWEEFIHAPNEVMERLMEQELEKRQLKTVTNDPDLHNSNARMLKIGRVDAWAGTSAFTGDWEPISSIYVSSAGSSTFTASNGIYIINTGPGSVCMSYNNSVMNGVSTLDLLLTQRHILGIDPFENVASPTDAARRYIAADLNHDGNISVQDVLLFRKIILGIVSFPGVNLVYIPKINLTLPNVTNPSFLSSSSLLSPCKAPTTSNMHRYAIKVGDVSGDFSF